MGITEALVTAGMTTFWAGVTTSAIMMAISIGLNYAIAALTPKEEQDEQEAGRESSRGHLVSTKSTEEVVPLIYGKMRVGTNTVYQSVSGADNSTLHMISTIGEGEIDGIEVDGSDIPQIWVNGEILQGSVYAPYITYTLYRGIANQNVCPDLPAEWNDALRYTAYLYLRLSYNRDIFQNIPEITVLVRGVKVLNPDLVTNPLQVLEYSNNPALCTRDFLTRSSRRGGMGIAPSRIDDDTVLETANYCTAKGWTIGLPLVDNSPAIDLLKSILATYRGAVVYTGSKFKVKFKDTNYETAVMDIDERDVVFNDDNSSLFIKQPSVFDTPNAIRLKYLDEEIKYQGNDYVFSPAIGIAGDLVTPDGDYREETYTIHGINTRTNAAKMTNYLLERARINKIFGHTGFARLMALEPMDLVNFTHEIPGWTNKLARVQSIGLTQNGDVAVNYAEETPFYPNDLVNYPNFLYDDTYNLAVHSWDDTNILSPSDPVPSVNNVTLTEEVYYYRERSFTRLKIDFEKPLESVYPFWDCAQVWVAVQSDPNIPIVTSDYKYVTKVEDNYIIDPVNEGVTYYVRLVSVNIWGKVQPFAETVETVRTVEGKTIEPQNLTSLTAVASGDSVSLISASTNEPDIEGYEVRMGNAWVGGTLIGFGKAPLIRLTGVKPGTFTFWMAPKGNNGRYSAEPVSATCTVFYPSGYADRATWEWQYAGAGTITYGTFNNTVPYLYNGTDPTLRCEQTNDVLTGTWLSPVYDLGCVTTIRTWGDFDTFFIGAGNTWDSIFPTYTNKYPFLHNSTYVKANERSVWERAYYATDPAKSVIGDPSMDLNSWLAPETKTTNQRFHIDLGSSVMINGAYYENYHNTGGSTNIGVRHFSLWGSDSISAFQSLTYTNDTNWNLITTTSTEFDIHVSADQADPKYVSATNTTAYRYYAFKFADNWGNATYMGLRRIVLVGGGATWDNRAPSITTWNQLNATEMVAATLRAKVYWGTSVDGNGAIVSPIEADYFQILAPEFTGRYVQVLVTLTDPAVGSTLYLRPLNIIAAYWT